ncbi:hypothetical protein BC830DRAFT_325378 [Chytriomyces sp. MP71]|nr:hypothetical protein BC830DRAFT_325378 [Chytriomyces sp. MP71]
MSHGISAIEKFLVFNTQIHAPEDVAIRSHIKGTVTFDTTQEIVVEDVQIKLECLEYKFHESPITPQEADADSSAGSTKPHHLNFLDHFTKHGKAPTKAAVTNHGADEEHVYPYELKFEIAASILPASKIHAAFAPGHQEFSFEIALPADAPLTVGIPKANGEVDLVVYRLHATVTAQGETTHTEAFSVVRVIEA